MSRTGRFAVQFATVGDVAVRAVDDSMTIPEAADDSRRSRPVLRNYRTSGMRNGRTGPASWYTRRVMRDTSEPALERYYELLRARTPLARLTTAVDLSSAVRQLAESSIRAADPGASTAVVRARLALRLYGRQVAARLFPGVKLDVG
jgi:hypothetical protein